MTNKLKKRFERPHLPHQEIKILTFNIHKGGKLNKRDYKIEKIREQLRILEPDLIFLQESFGAQFEYLAEELWPHLSYGKNATSRRGHHGNAILSKYPILFSDNFDISMGKYEKRGFLHTITHPTFLSRPLHLICIHLGLFRKDRKKQLAQIVDYIAKEISDEDFLVLGGDFNDWNNDASHMLQDIGLVEVFQVGSGKHAKTFPALLPVLQLDRIYIRGFDISTFERLTHRHWKLLSDHIALSAVIKPK